MIQPHDTGGWLIKDPVSLQYTLLSSLEYQVFQRLDGQSDLNTVFASGSDHRVTAQDLESFLSHLIKRQLLFRPKGGDAERFYGLRAKTTTPFAWLTRLLSWYVPLGNPRHLLARLQWVNSIVFQRLFIYFSMILFTIGTLVCGLKSDRVITDVGHLASSFTSGSVSSLLFILVIVKFAHELGHALAARHYGADCHEAGILFLFLTPVPFTNVTDSWRLPVAQRMVVTAAGIIVELWIASFCMILWSIAAEGHTRDLLLQTALICSVNTLLFNGNPLLKFDGYFLLSDYLRIPNLSPRSTQLLRSMCTAFLAGRPIQVNERDDRNALVTYGALACLYRIILAFSILEAIHLVCSSNDLRALGWFLKLLTGVMLIGLPAFRFLLALLVAPPIAATSESVDSVVTNAAPTWKTGAIRTGLLLVAMTGIGLLPLPSRIICIATVTPSEHRIFAGTSGLLSIDSTSTNKPMTADIWNLDTPESQLGLHQIQAERDLAAVQLQIAKRTQRTGTGPSIQELQKAVASAEQRLSDFKHTVATQRQPITDSGTTLIPARRYQDTTNGAFHEDWTGLPLSTQNLGAWIQKGTTLGYVATNQTVLITTWVPQSDIQKIEVGQKAWFRLDAGSAKPLDAIVKDISRFPTQTLPSHIAISGSLRGQPTDSGFRPEQTLYAVTLQTLPHDSNFSLPLNGTGLASVLVENRSLANRFYDYLRQTFVLSPKS
ncbi:MAG: HlyD family efflux transporter periplasmic adaptor subunit [Fuerstiella sp.]